MVGGLRDAKILHAKLRLRTIIGILYVQLRFFGVSSPISLTKRHGSPRTHYCAFAGEGRQDITVNVWARPVQRVVRLILSVLL